MKPTRCFLTLTSGESMIPLAQIGKSSSAPALRDAPMVFQGAALPHLLTLKAVEEEAPPSLTSSRRFLGEAALGVWVVWGVRQIRLDRGICGGAPGTISSSPLR